MRKIMIVAATCLLSSATSAAASTSGIGMISGVYSVSNGVILFTLCGDRSPTPACHTITGRWAFDGSTAAGQGKLAVLLTAYAQGKPIQVDGLGNCNVWGDTESVNFILIP